MSAPQPPGRVPLETLRRFLAPKSVAIVGASESSPRHAVRALLESDLEVHLVNPRRDTVFGHPTVPDLTSLAGRVDAVLTLVNAKAAVGAIRDAAAIGAAGVAVNAAGFAEVGADGAALQAELVSAAGTGTAVLGPNCNGFINARTGAFLAGAPDLPLRAGSVGVITHSGGFITDLAVAARGRHIGFSALVSTGNEAVTDLVDYLNYFIDDPATDAVCLVIEHIKRPGAFFAAAERARQAGKPVVALKLGRSSRGREVAKSHTGSIVGESWTYDAAFAQFGVQLAADLGDLLDRVMLFDQLPRARWTPVAGLGVVSVSGGGAALVSDLCESEGVPLSPLASVEAQVTAVLPSASVMNPLDMTGFVMSRPEVVRAIFDAYATSDEVDTLLTMWTLGLDQRGFADALLLPFAEVAARTDKAVVLSATADGSVSEWATDLLVPGMAVSPSLRSAIRSFAAMAAFAASSQRPARIQQPAVAERPLPAAYVVQTPDGDLLRFGASMDLLVSAGFAVAPYCVFPGHAPVSQVELGFAGPYVVKVADCAHRTELGAVKVGVAAHRLGAVADELRAIAGRRGLPTDIVVQAMLEADGEAFLGGQCEGDLGPLVAFGLGGVDVEALNRISGRLVPVTADDATHLLAELDSTGVFTGTRGREPWDRRASIEAITGMSDLLASTRSWLLSVDINPLMRTPAGFVAVDAAVFVRRNNAPLDESS